MTRPAASLWRAARQALALGLCLAAMTSNANDGDAVAVVERLHAGIVAAAADRDSTVEDRYAALEPLIESTHDLESIARLTVRRQWADFTDDERRRFLAAFERLSVMTYASRFAGVGEGTFEIAGRGDAGRGRIEVNARIIRSDADPVPLDYVLEESAAGWRIVNIFADGVSDLALKRAEYQRILAQGSIEDLIVHITAQADDLVG
jgi:phospholipid transport system substrate-binding protein